MRGKNKVAGEDALIMLTFRRLLNLIGITLFQKLMKALKTGDLESIKQEIVEYLAVLGSFLAFLLQQSEWKRWNASKNFETHGFGGLRG